MRRRWAVLISVVAYLLLIANAPAATFTASYSGLNIWWPLPDECNLAEPMQGAEPDGPGPFPVLVYAHGTYSDWGNLATGAEVVKQAAARGFVAVAPKYDSWATLSAAGVEKHARCMFRDAPTSALSVACSRPKADCNLGVFVMGHSQGGAIAGRAANWSAKVKSALLLGVSAPVVPEAVPPSRALPNDRLRIVDGRQGVNVADVNALTGLSCASGPTCLRADGSGWVLVQDAQVTDGAADHCFMEVGGCQLNPVVDPRWLSTSEPWGLGPGLDWLG